MPLIPRTTAHVAQPGAVFLAGATRHRILPFHVEAARSWTLRTWDRTQVPAPFSTVSIAIGVSIGVEDTSDGTVEAGRVALEAALRTCEARAADILDTRAP